LTEPDLHIIEAYLHDRLRPEEKADFEQKMKLDPELRALVSQMRATVIAIRQSAMDEKLDMLKEEEKKMAVLDQSSFRITPLYKWVAVAAVLLIGLFFVFPLFKPDDTIRNPYLAEHFDDYVLHSITRGNNSDQKVTPEQELAYNLYGTKQFHKAMPLLEELWEEKGDTLALFYLGVSEKAMGNEEKSDSYFFKIRQTTKFNKLIIEIDGH